MFELNYIRHLVATLCIKLNFIFFFLLGEGDESLQQIRECLKLDPEHKDCYPFYKKVKKVVKFLTSAQEAQTSQDWEECVTAANKVLKNEPKVSNFSGPYCAMASLRIYDSGCKFLIVVLVHSALRLNTLLKRPRQCERALIRDSKYSLHKIIV